MNVRFAPVQSPATIETVAALAREIWQEHFTSIIGPSQVAYMLEHLQSVPAIRRQIEQGTGYWLIHLDGQAVGYLALAREPRRDSLFLSKLYLLARVRGRGLARTALEFIEAEARRAGLSAIRLTCNRHNHTALAAYRQLGFTRAGTAVKDIGGGFVMDDYVLVKSVGPQPTT